MVTFSNTVVVTDLETFVNTLPTKEHDGLSDISKKYEDLVWYGITNQYNLLLVHIYSLYTDELELCFYRVEKLLKKILKDGKSPILEGGGGRNKILGPQFKSILYNLLIIVQSILNFRKQTSITITI